MRSLAVSVLIVVLAFPNVVVGQDPQPTGPFDDGRHEDAVKRCAQPEPPPETIFLPGAAYPSRSEGRGSSAVPRLGSAPIRQPLVACRRVCHRSHRLECSLASRRPRKRSPCRATKFHTTISWPGAERAEQWEPAAAAFEKARASSVFGVRNYYADCLSRFDESIRW